MAFKKGKRYFENYNSEELKKVASTATDPVAKRLRAQTLGEIIVTEYEWESSFINLLAKRVTVPDGVTPSYYNRTKKNNEIFFIASDDGIVQHSTVRPDT